MKEVKIDLTKLDDYNAQDLMGVLIESVKVMADSEEYPDVQAQLANVDANTISSVSVNEHGIITLQFKE